MKNIRTYTYIYMYIEYLDAQGRVYRDKGFLSGLRVRYYMSRFLNPGFRVKDETR